MSNPLFGMMQNSQNNLLQRFQQFKQTFKGDPSQQIQQMLNSGKVTQAQYNHAVQLAQQMQRMMGK